MSEGRGGGNKKVDILMVTPSFCTQPISTLTPTLEVYWLSIFLGGKRGHQIAMCETRDLQGTTSQTDSSTPLASPALQEAYGRHFIKSPDLPRSARCHLDHRKVFVDPELMLSALSNRKLAPLHGIGETGACGGHSHHLSLHGTHSSLGLKALFNTKENCSDLDTCQNLCFQ
jgi:hypothetical protein